VNLVFRRDNRGAEIPEYITVAGILILVAILAILAIASTTRTKAGVTNSAMSSNIPSAASAAP